MGYKLLFLGAFFWGFSFFTSLYYKQFMTLGSNIVCVSFIIILFETMFHFKDSVSDITKAVKKLSEDISFLKDKNVKK